MKKLSLLVALWALTPTQVWAQDPDSTQVPPDSATTAPVVASPDSVEGVMPDSATAQPDSATASAEETPAEEVEEAVEEAPRESTLGAVFIRRATSPQDFVDIIMAGPDGDISVMPYTTASLLVANLNEVHGLQLEHRDDLARFIMEETEFAPCGVGQAEFGRVRKTTGEFVSPWSRMINDGEMCFWHAGQSILSAWCGNPTPSLTRAVVVATEPTVAVAPARAPVVEAPREPERRVDPAIAESLAQTASRTAESLPVRRQPAWYSWSRPEGKVLWIGAAVTTVGTVVWLIIDHIEIRTGDNYNIFHR